ncbi:hypothetical protein CsatB_028046 [Cannabis sativa]
MIRNSYQMVSEQIDLATMENSKLIFYGDDPYGWVTDIEEYFRHHRIRESMKVSVATTCLRGVAWRWFQAVEEQDPIRNWLEFRIAMFNCCSRIKDDPYDKLMALRYDGSATEFRDRFETTANQLPDIPVTFLRDIFFGKLPAEIAIGVHEYRPKTLAEVIAKALMVEEQMKMARNFSNGGVNPFGFSAEVVKTVDESTTPFKSEGDVPSDVTDDEKDIRSEKKTQRGTAPRKEEMETTPVLEMMPECWRRHWLCSWEMIPVLYKEKPSQNIPPKIRQAWQGKATRLERHLLPMAMEAHKLFDRGKNDQLVIDAVKNEVMTVSNLRSALRMLLAKHHEMALRDTPSKTNRSSSELKEMIGAQLKDPNIGIFFSLLGLCWSEILSWRGETRRGLKVEPPVKKGNRRGLIPSDLVFLVESPEKMKSGVSFLSRVMEKGSFVRMFTFDPTQIMAQSNTNMGPLIIGGHEPKLLDPQLRMGLIMGFHGLISWNLDSEAYFPKFSIPIGPGPFTKGHVQFKQNPFFPKPTRISDYTYRDTMKIFFPYVYFVYWRSTFQLLRQSVANYHAMDGRESLYFMLERVFSLMLLEKLSSVILNEGWERKHQLDELSIEVALWKYNYQFLVCNVSLSFLGPHCCWVFDRGKKMNPEHNQILANSVFGPSLLDRLSGAPFAATTATVLPFFLHAKGDTINLLSWFFDRGRLTKERCLSPSLNTIHLLAWFFDRGRAKNCCGGLCSSP